jgi:hypothetical protein
VVAILVARAPSTSNAGDRFLEPLSNSVEHGLSPSAQRGQMSRRHPTLKVSSVATCATVGLAARAHTGIFAASLCVAMCSQAVGRPAQSLAWLFWTAPCRTGRGVHGSLRERFLDNSDASSSPASLHLDVRSRCPLPTRRAGLQQPRCNINLVCQIDDHEATPTSSLNWVLCRSTRAGMHATKVGSLTARSRSSRFNSHAHALYAVQCSNKSTVRPSVLV